MYDSYGDDDDAYDADDANDDDSNDGSNDDNADDNADDDMLMTCMSMCRRGARGISRLQKENSSGKPPQIIICL